MKFYLVGGAVRDLAMDKVPNDRDYVIVGATELDIRVLLKKGYTQVGRDFPVFLHPETGAEYALARIERKTGVGYNGFECSTENVTLEQDLARRDFTMNAIAYDYTNNIIIDPFKGKNDIKNKVIKHVSAAFSEDPVRVLRAARFANTMNFNIHKSTKALIKKMVKNGELAHLTKERVLLEITKALKVPRIDIFINSLVELTAWDILFPELLNISKHHIHFINKVISNAGSLDRNDLFWVSLLYMIKEKDLQTLNARYTLPNSAIKFHNIIQKTKKTITTLSTLKASEIVEFFDGANFKNLHEEDTIYKIFDVLQSRTPKRLDVEFVIKAYNIYKNINAEELLAKAGNPKGLEARECIKNARIAKFELFLS